MSCKCAMCQNNVPFKMPNEIISAAKKGTLSLFCGAGISTEKRGVLPYSFYTQIQKELKITDANISFSELMQKYCDEPNGRRKMLQTLKQRFDYIHSFPELERQATSFHTELSELYFLNTIITTNWDTYFEDYCNAIPIVTPEDFAFWDSRKRYVLKIHGSISNLGSIIATKDDYKKCTESLTKGIIGATLKTILANNTVVFIGFSFGDEDFAQIMNYLQDEMKEIYPHIFVVTLDPNMQNHIKYKKSTCIVTDGTYFLHQLKLELQREHLIVNTHSMPYIQSAYSKMLKYHQKISALNLATYPNNIYCLAYQDGVLHAFERFIQLYNSGTYNKPGYISHIADSYEQLINIRLQADNLWDAAYYEGYLNGVILIEACDKKSSALKIFPYFYLPNAKCSLDTIKIYAKELKRTSLLSDKYRKYEKKTIKNFIDTDLTVHHPPY